MKLALMKLDRWKRRFARCIYQTPSGIRVFQNFFYRWLTIETKTVQSCINRFMPEKTSLSYIQYMTLAIKAQPADCCLFGLGGAGIPHALNTLLQSHQKQLVAVEKSHEIIAIANDFFFTAQLPCLKIIHQDAQEYAQHCQTQYQHLFIDLFNSKSFPPECCHTNFFSHCHRMLLPGGILAINLAHSKEQWTILQLIREYFHHSTVAFPIPGKTNLVILACKTPSVSQLLAMIQAAEPNPKHLVWDARWGYLAKF